jgi:hypothetical protein
MANWYAAWESGPTRPFTCSPSYCYTRAESAEHCRERSGFSMSLRSPAPPWELDLHGRATQHPRPAFRLRSARPLRPLRGRSQPWLTVRHRQAVRFCVTRPTRGRRCEYFSLLGGVGLPAAKFSIIAEHVWLLEKTSAPTAFLVFGNDRAIPQRWLARYAELASSVAFFFLHEDGTLDRLVGPDQ